MPSTTSASQKALWQVPLKYGLIGATLNGVLFLVLYWLGENPLTVAGPFDFSFIIVPLMIYFSLREFKSYHNQGELRFWQGLAAGFVCYFVLAITFAVLLYFFLEYLDASILEGYKQNRLELLRQNQAPMTDQFGAAAYNEQVSKTEQTSSYIKALDDFWKKLIIGLLLAIPISVILRK
ncbi:MAG: DUF4199 domain-containing protein [Aurantibacter sp.]